MNPRASSASIQLTLGSKKAVSSAVAVGRAQRLKVAGLFAGIGGFELGLQRAGHETTLLCEIEPTARAVLNAHFPEVRKHDDVCTLKGPPKGTGLLVGGFPCQDLSQAGLTRGITGSRSGLVGEVFRMLEGCRVPYVLLENVPFMLQLARGEALEVIVAALEGLGYKWAYRVVDSQSFGVPQRRERVYLLASLDRDPRDVLLVDDVGSIPDLRTFPDVACGFYWTEGLRGLGWAVDSVPTLKSGSTIGIPSPPGILLPNGMVVKPDLRDAERMQGFEEDWTRPAEAVAKRGARWKLVGNAVTVNAAEWIGKRLARPGNFIEPALTSPIRPGRAWPRVGWNVGDGRVTTDAISRWPMRVPHAPLETYLRHPPQALSLRAISGFLSRARGSSLRFPPRFISTLEAYQRWVAKQEARAA